MARAAIDRLSLLALVMETISRFPPQKDSDNVRAFRRISVDYLEGKITHPQFNLLYTKEKTAEQITDEILDLLKARQPRKTVNPGHTGETPPNKWRVQPQRKTLRRFWNG
jgi:hypothetical protein